MKISTYNYIMSSQTSVQTTDNVVQPLATAVCTFAIVQFVFNESNFNTLLFYEFHLAQVHIKGLCIGSLSPDLLHYLPVFLGNGKGIIERVAEIGFGVGTSYDVIYLFFKKYL